MEIICNGAAGLRILDGYEGGQPPLPQPSVPILVLRRNVCVLCAALYGEGVAICIGPRAPLVGYGTFPFYSVGVCINVWKMPMVGAVILGV